MTDHRSEELTDETNRLLARLIRLHTDSQSEAIVELHRAGIATGRIAELLGTTSGTANVAIHRAKQKKSNKE